MKDINPNAKVTEVFVTQIYPGTEVSFKKWIEKIRKLEEKSLGFCGVFIQHAVSIPADKNRWITFLQFDSQENLDAWLSSPERKAILQEAEDLIDSIERHRVISDHPSWFKYFYQGQQKAPPLWKQAMLILLVLFPIVMIEMSLLSPHTASLNRSLAMFIGNVISVSLVTWPLMPLAVRSMRWWLCIKEDQNYWWKTFGGVFLLIALYTCEVLIFS